MATKVTNRSHKLSYDILINNVESFFNDGETPFDEIKRIADKVVKTTDSMFPGSLTWYPHTSEIHAGSNDDTSITDEEAAEIINEACGIVFYEEI